MLLNDPFHNHPWRWWILLFCLGALSFGFRYYYVIHAQVQQPRGDAIEYIAYARNLVLHGTFSAAPEGTAPLIGDSFRDPGYPLLLAGWMKIFSQWNIWYATLLIFQALLSGVTVVLLLCLGRRWMPTRWLAAAGLLMAVWPHSVAMSGYLLSETLYGFLCALGLFLLSVALARKSPGWAAASGLGLSLAALTNAVLLPFAFLLAVYMLLRRQFNAAMFTSFVIAALAVTAPWAIRNAMLPSGHSSATGRALTNLVQGSWPTYHSAYQAKVADSPDAGALMAPIDRETMAIHENFGSGIAQMRDRMASQPGTYIRWYLGKPFMLWDWSVRVGQGDIYVFPTRYSPFETNMAYRMVAAISRALNPWLFMLAIAGCLLALLRAQKSRAEIGAAALMCLFITAVYSALQADPRYSVPYRGLEIMLAAFGVCCGYGKLASWRAKKATIPERDSR